MRVSSSAADFEPSVLASRCSSWIRKSSRLPSSPPWRSSRAISSRWDCSRPSSSATSMRIAKAAASDIARSASASAGTPCEAPAAASASFQRSRKRWRWRSTTCGTSGAACAASARSASTRSIRMATRRSPSRARASRSRATHSRAASAAASSSTGAGAVERHQASASCTLIGADCGSAASTADCSAPSRASCSAAGGRTSVSARSPCRRSSILPRLKACVSCSRKPGSRARSSSGRRSVRSRKRLLTERSSTVTVPARTAVDSVFSPVSGPVPALALA